jgi:thioredoxin 1
MAVNGIVILLLSGGIGALIGGMLGTTKSCQTGGCPLTANPGRGALVGAILGITIAMASGVGSGSCPFLSPSAGTEQGEGEAGTHLTALSTETFDEAVAEGVVLVDFWATWCGPCQRQLPILDGLATDAGTPFKIAKVNVDEQRDLAEKYGVSLLPTLVFFRDGKPVKTLEGLQSKKELLAAYGKL